MPRRPDALLADHVSLAAFFGLLCGYHAEVLWKKNGKFKILENVVDTGRGHVV